MAHGIYHDMPHVRARDYVLHYRPSRVPRWQVDRVGARGTHTTIGPTRGYSDIDAVRTAIENDAHVQGVLNCTVHDASGEILGALTNGRLLWYPGALAIYPSLAMRANGRRSDPDEHAATELLIYMDNTNGLALGSTMGQGKSVRENLLRRWNKGQYDFDKSVKLMSYLVETGAKAYVKENRSDRSWHAMFNPATRDAVAYALAEQFQREARGGEYD